MGYLEAAKRLLRTREAAPEATAALPCIQGAKSDLSDKRLVKLLVPFPDMRAFHKWEIWRAQVRAMNAWLRDHPNCNRCAKPGAATRPLARGGYLVLCGQCAGHLPECRCGCRRVRTEVSA